MSNVQVTVYTDPGCPFGFNAQRQDLQLLWHYGEAIDVSRRMIVLLEETVTYEERGLPIGVIADAMARLLDDYGMPMLATPAPRMAATIDGCRAFIGATIKPTARAHSYGRCAPRCSRMATRSTSRRRSTTRPARLLSSPRRSTHGSPTTRSLPRLPRIWRQRARPCPRRAGPRAPPVRPRWVTALFDRLGDLRARRARGRRCGFQPFGVHEVAMANVAPDVERRPEPGITVDEILAWAPSTRWPPPRSPRSATSRSTRRAPSSRSRAPASALRPATATGQRRRSRGRTSRRCSRPRTGRGPRERRRRDREAHRVVRVVRDHAPRRRQAQPHPA